MSVRVQREDFDIGAEVARLTAGRTDIGAIVTFTGAVRAENEGTGVTAMTLEHYPGMTEQELERVEAEATQRWALQASLIVHRVGTLKPGDNIVLVVTASSHRQAAFDAAAFLMDYLKTRAPFWKKELGADGQERWVDARDSDEVAAGRWKEGAEVDEALRRFDVELLIVHPTLTPEEISATLGLEAQSSQREGERRMTPKGTPLEGNYRDTRWRYSIRHEVRAQDFADKIAAMVQNLAPHKAFLHKVRDTGGRATLIVQFLGDGYFGDEVRREILATLAALQLDLGVECFNDRQVHS